MKKWLYLDQLIKPEEAVLFRSTEEGGLGLVSLRNNSKACFLRTFIEMSVNPVYKHSTFLSSIFRFYVSKEDISCPQLPPYFTSDMFTTIINARDSGQNITSMKTRHWYQYLMEQEYYVVNPVTDEKEIKRCKTEIKSPEVDWQVVWPNCRHTSFDAGMSSFAFQLLHDLLPCDARMADIFPNTSDSCRHSCPGDPTGNLSHVFFHCHMSGQVGEWLYQLVKKTEQTITRDSLLKLEIIGNESLLWITVATLKFLWIKRSKGKKVDVQEMIAFLKSELQLLESTI